MENFKEIQVGLPKAELPRGSYVVDVEYQSEGIAHLAVSYSHGRGNWDLSGKVMLSDGESHKKFGITVEDGEEPFFIAGRLNSECLQGDYLLLQGITISRSFEWYRVRLFGLFVVFLQENPLPAAPPLFLLSCSGERLYPAAYRCSPPKAV